MTEYNLEDDNNVSQTPYGQPSAPAGGNDDGKKSRPKASRRRKVVRWLWTGFLGLGFIIALLLTLVYNGVIGYMPPIEELEDPHDKLASVVYAGDGTTELGRYFQGAGNRISSDYSEVSPHVIDALIATEDIRFEEHSGIDFRSLGRTLVKTVLMQDKSSGGGSTITQQLAKQLYSQPSNNLFKRALQKPIEWMIAIKLERFYTKDEIVNMYLNRFDFLNNAVGIKTAANVYFGKEPANLSVTEAAMLVGMLKNPSYYNPLRQPERTLQRRNVVLDQMVKAGKLPAAEAEALKATPLGLDYHRVDHKEGEVPYMREEIRRLITAEKPKRPKKDDYKSDVSWKIALSNYQTDSTQWETNPLYGWIAKNPKADGSYYDIYADGLRIYTTIDSRMQRYAEEAVHEHLSDLQRRFDREKRGMPYTSNPNELSAAGREKLIRNAIRQSERYRVAKAAGLSDDEITKQFDTPVDMTLFSYNGPVEKTMTPRDSILYVKSFLRTGFMSMDPRNGHVKAYVGGPDFRFFQYDMVSTGRRQIGSTIKPFLYTLAMESGFSPCSTFLNAQPTYTDAAGNVWSPRNSGRARIGEMVDLRWALTNSNNWISARLINEVGPSRLVNLMHNLGITNKLPSVMSLALGPCEVSVREMVAAYSAFANKGMRVDPIYVTAITDNNGNVLAQFSPNQTEVISETAYYRILSILLNVVDSGTGNRLRRAPYALTAQIGGKTGTTNFNADGWFMGFTPELVSGVWVGGDERYIHFNTMADGQGAEMALPIYGRYMRKVYNDKTLPYSQSTAFAFPPGISLCDGYEGPEVEAEEATVGDVFD